MHCMCFLYIHVCKYIVILLFDETLLFTHKCMLNSIDLLHGLVKHISVPFKPFLPRGPTWLGCCCEVIETIVIDGNFSVFPMSRSSIRAVQTILIRHFSANFFF